MDASNVSFGLAVLAGLLSFLSPCVLSLVPAYIGYLGGRAVTTSGQQSESNRWLTFSHGIAFVLGMSFVLVFLIGVPTGLVVALLGRTDPQAEGFLYDFKTILSQVGGLIVIVFGLHTMGVITIPFLEYDTRKQVAPRSELGYLSSFMMGVFFTAGWSPCVGPVLTLIINMGLAAETTGRAVWLLAAYSIGLAIPFIISALAVGQVTQFIRTYSKYTRYVSIATGVLMIVIGVLLLTGTYQRIAGVFSSWGTIFNFGL